MAAPIEGTAMAMSAHKFARQVDEWLGLATIMCRPSRSVLLITKVILHAMVHGSQEQLNRPSFKHRLTGANWQQSINGERCRRECRYGFTGDRVGEGQLRRMQKQARGGSVGFPMSIHVAP